ncbi:MAG: S8 family peptidase [Candidatus Eisenbacteria sp.]|nr:S8 family peptidase [Candidatus Eisenbacteria bacterium]
MRYLALSILLMPCLALPSGAGSGDYVPNQMCCLLEEGYTIDEVNLRWGTTTLVAYVEDDLYLLFISGVEDLEAFAALMTEDEAVDLAEANYRVETPEGVRQMVIAAVGGTWDDYQDQSLTERIRLDDAHLHSCGANVTVGVLDTGIDPTHAAFEGRLSDDGFDCVDFDQEPWETANGLDDDQDGLIDEGFGHGTMVAGLVALVAPEATILPVRVLNDEGCGTLFGITKGIMCAISHGADVINMSFGAPTVMVSIKKKLRVANVHEAIAVAGAGNRNQEQPPYHPACDSLAFMITALDSLDVKADFADFNAKVLVAAPGVGVRSAYPGDEWAIGSGCSFATPLVAGEVALILSLSPELDAVEVAERLERGVDPIYHLPENQAYIDMLGAGRICLPEALYGLSAGLPDISSASAEVRVWPNPSTGTFYFRSPHSLQVGEGPRVRVYDTCGRLIRTIRPAGARGLLIWEGRDSSGRLVSPGFYWAHMTSDVQARTIPLTILR